MLGERNREKLPINKEQENIAVLFDPTSGNCPHGQFRPFRVALQKKEVTIDSAFKPYLFSHYLTNPSGL